MINGRAASYPRRRCDANIWYSWHLHHERSVQWSSAVRQGRPSAAKLIVQLSLRARLLLLVAMVVAAVLTTSTYFEVRSFERVA